jgi:coenzyme F420-0:L-glutamate ligase/coenzyme F420-1:gamma-L-glutamate ligase
VSPPATLSFQPLAGFPLVQAGDDLAALILAALSANDVRPAEGDIVVVTSKVVSKAEGRITDLATVVPSTRALELAERTGKDPRLVEVILDEAVGVSRAMTGVLIVRHRLGFTSANAGIDHSNVGGGEEEILLLPIDPDSSARRIRKRLEEETSVRIGVVISDTHGRPFRLGNVGVAIGVAGVPALVDLRGELDLFGQPLRASEVPLADQVAAAAGLVSGEAAEGVPVVLVCGLQRALVNERQAELSRAADVIRPAGRDLYA